jgi:hypothetical protein
MKRTVEELNHRAERFAQAQENLEARVELTTELKRPEFQRQLSGPAGAFLADAIIQTSGLDARAWPCRTAQRSFRLTRRPARPTRAWFRLTRSWKDWK